MSVTGEAVPDAGPTRGAPLSLSELVMRTGVPPSTIHHYRRAALIPPPTRSALNRFGYDERHVTTLRLIRILRERKGLSLDEIAQELPGLLARPDVMADLDEVDPDDESDVACRLTDAAIQAFQTRSFGEVTISDIAESAGVAKGSVYRHFASKEDLFTAAIERVLARTATEFAGTVSRLGGTAGVAKVPEAAAAEFAGVVALAMPMLLELGTRAAKGNKASELLARRVLRTLAEATGRPLVSGTDDDPIPAGLAVIQTAFSVMLGWAVGTDWPPDESLQGAGVGPHHQPEGEAVVALATDGLHGRGLDPGLGRHGLEDQAHPHHVVVGGAAADDRPPTHDVVDDDQAAGPGEAQRPVEVNGVGRLVGVDEDQVERLRPLLMQARQAVGGPAHADLHDPRHAGPVEVAPGDGGVAGVDLQGDQPAPRGEGPRQPDRAVAPERADLEDPGGADAAGEKVEQLPLGR